MLTDASLIALKSGVRGPSLLEDFHFREKITHFDHERIPERIVHARGSAAHGHGVLYVDPKGDVHDLGAVWGNDTARLLISPDGQHLAFDKWNTATASNVWLIENF